METILIDREQFEKWTRQPIPFKELIGRLEALETLRPVKVAGYPYEVTPKGLKNDLRSIQSVQGKDKSTRLTYAATYDRILLMLRANEQAN